MVVRRAYPSRAPMENASRCKMCRRHNFTFETFPFVAEPHDWLKGELGQAFGGAGRKPDAVTGNT
jgi:hypothetical protein